jgi:aminobenzoyl-glutamate utilization protein B
MAARFARAWVDEHAADLTALEAEIWELAEPAWREYRSAARTVEFLREHGFAVETGTAGMPTAFRAEWGSGEPTVATYAEYDAVPGNSQRRVPRRAPREGLHPYAPGHTDPHSVLGVGAIGGALAAQAAMREFDLDGTLVVFGEPAEKVCGSKPVHAAHGHYDDLDAAIAYHPYPENTVEHRTYCGSYWSAVYTFEADHPERWASPALIPSESSHATARSPGALDAVSLMYTSTKHLKEALFPHTGSWTVNEYVMTGGQKTSDNLVPRIGQIQYCWRAPSLAIQERIAEVLRTNAARVAELTDCAASVRRVTRTRVGLPNTALADRAYEAMVAAGAPSVDEEARAFAREIQAELGVEPMDEPFRPAAFELRPPAEHEARVRERLPDWQTNFTSDDYVEYTWHAPTARIHTGRPRLARPDPDYSYPEWAYNALGGVSAVTAPGMLLASRTIAGTVVGLLTEPDALAAARAEFEERTGGGIGGDDWVGPLLEDGFAAPIDLPWPEYVETERGRGWSLPTPERGLGERIAGSADGPRR